MNRRTMTVSLMLGAAMWWAGFKMVSCYLDTSPIRAAAVLDDDDAGR